MKASKARKSVNALFGAENFVGIILPKNRISHLMPACDISIDVDAALLAQLECIQKLFFRRILSGRRQPFPCCVVILRDGNVAGQITSYHTRPTILAIYSISSSSPFLFYVMVESLALVRASSRYRSKPQTEGYTDSPCHQLRQKLWSTSCVSRNLAMTGLSTNLPRTISP